MKQDNKSSKCLARGADQLILTQCPIVIAYCLHAPKDSPSIPSDNVTELNEQVNIIQSISTVNIIQHYL